MSTSASALSYRNASPADSPLFRASQCDSSSPGRRSSQEWVLAAKRSCLNMTVMEPCVNKAINHLEFLKELAQKKSAVQMDCSLEVTGKSSSSTRGEREDESSVVRIAKTPELIAEGVAIGVFPNGDKVKVSKSEMHNMVSGLMNLIAKLEKDRQEVLVAIAAEKDKAKMLQDKLDKEGERRLAILPELVQAEHEQCIKDIRHLKWHAAREWKKLKKQQENERISTKLNEDRKTEVKQYTDAGPQMREKMELDSSSIEEIAAEQERTSKSLAAAIKECEEIDAKFGEVMDDSMSERQNLATTKGDAETELFSAQDDLKAVCDKYASTSRSVREAEQRIETLGKKMEDMDAEKNNSELRITSLCEHVAELETECKQMDEERDVLTERKMKLITVMENERQTLDRKRQALKSERDEADRTLKQSTRSMEEMEQNIDTARETIAATKKKIIDDEKSVERAQRELTELEKQIEVALADFTQIQQDHSRITDELNLEKYRMKEEVDILQSKIGGLNQAIQDENRIKCLYENKIDTNKAQIEKMKVDYEQAIHEAQKSVETSEELGAKQETTLADVEKFYVDKVEELQILEKEFAALMENHGVTKQDLTDKVSTLVPLEKQLRVELQEKVNRIEVVLEKIKEFEVKVEEAVKSTKVMEKLETTISASIESLKSELGILEEKLAIERLKEQSWRDEYKEISDFSSEADAKHNKYLKDRTKYLEKCKTNLQDSLSRNSELSAEFLRIQKEFLEIKARAIAAMEGRLRLENSIKDHKQLLMSLDFMFSSLKEYYNIRGIMCNWNLDYFTDSSDKNVHDLHRLKRKYEHILAILQNFFDIESKLE